MKPCLQCHGHNNDHESLPVQTELAGSRGLENCGRGSSREGFEQKFRWIGFPQIDIGTGIEGLGAVTFRIKHRQNDNLNLRMLEAESGDGLEIDPIMDQEIEDEGVGPRLRQLFAKILPIGGFSTDLKLIPSLNDLTDSLPEERVVINDEDPFSRRGVPWEIAGIG
jgi:hypothetical protein